MTSAISLLRYGDLPGDGTQTLTEWIREPYRAYAYSYPHKTAYRRLDPQPELASLWADEDRSALFLYAHIPFCESRCGYCNLFARPAREDSSQLASYVDALERQAASVRSCMDTAACARFAVGGGTPTRLPVALLDRVLSIADRVFHAPVRLTPTSVETSPDTASDDHVALLREHGVSRVSIGVQSFVAEENRAAGRHPAIVKVCEALDRLRNADFGCLNIDLIYGLPGQSVESWLTSIRRAMSWQPEEVYLYPLYVRPKTGLEQHERAWPDIRLRLYREGRDLLLAEGYQQHSMRRFRRAATATGPRYSCQEDGMIGLGCGARSYTKGLHYSEEWAVGANHVSDILSAYTRRTAEDFRRARFGYELDLEDQQRRYVIKSLLQREGLSRSRFRTLFDADAFEVLPQLLQLVELDLVRISDVSVVLTASGMELSDSIGPWLFSQRATVRSRGYEVR